ncbi:MAG: hypothetical protein KHZ48_09450 [Peptostreptococcaceae bacterium]|nr:hypothetical protein [uncultured Romboutsia sp.]MBS5025912.1 hypothetical protein [Peptostreptococcaceae bacterium]
MGSININYGNSMSMGDNNIVIGNSIGEHRKGLEISELDIAKLKELADRISIHREDDIKASEMMRAGNIIATLAEAAEEQDEDVQQESIINWNKFKQQAKPKIMEAINFISTGLSIGVSLKDLLGI